MLSAVSYYVHHRGAGHRARFEAIQAVASVRLVAVSELDIAGGCHLPADVAGPASNAGEDPTAGGGLHWAPIKTACAAGRLATFAGHLHDVGPVGAVVDVSVEAALTYRLAGVPTIIMRQHGRRDDPAHLLGYRTAQRLVAPWPAALEDPDAAPWILDKTVHVGFIAGPRPAGAVPSSLGVGVEPDDAVILWGAGGGQLDLATVVAVARAVHPGRVHCVGHDIINGDLARLPPSVHVHGWVNDVAAVLGRRPLLIASAGNNAVAEAARAGCPLVVVPQARPFDEQVRHAELLDASAVAAVAWRSGQDAPWDELMRIAGDRAGALSSLGGDDGACRAADVISECFA